MASSCDELGLEQGEHVCCSCKKETTEDQSFIVVRANGKKNLTDIRRCRRCHALKARMDRLIARKGDVPGWSEMTAEQKTLFCQKHHDAVGDDLLMRMQETVVLAQSRSTLTSFSGAGKYMDEIDLEIKYAGKPDQLLNIKTTARTIMHPTRNVLLYEDVEFESRQTEEEKREQSNRMKLEFAPTENGKGGKRKQSGASGKGGKASKQLKTEESVLNKVKAGDKKKLLKIDTTLETSTLQIKAQIDLAKGDDLKDLVPNYVVAAGETCLAKLAEARAQIAAIVASGQANNLEQTTSDLNETVEEATTTLQRVKVQVSEALDFKG